MNAQASLEWFVFLVSAVGIVAFLTAVWAYLMHWNERRCTSEGSVPKHD